MSDVWIWRAWGDVWQVGDGEDFFIWLIFKFFAILILAAVTIVVLIPVLIYEALRTRQEQLAVDDTARQLGLDPSRFGPCPYCGNEQMRDGRLCVRCGRG